MMDIILYGAGNEAEVFYKSFSEKVNICYVVDKSLQGGKFHELPVYDPKIIAEDKKFVLVAVGDPLYPEIKNYLQIIGLAEGKDFVKADFWVYEREEENIRKIRAFHNIHKGKRAFVIGNGPSLTVDDLNMLKNEITFASNGIFGLYGKTNWRPTYYVSQDLNVIESFYKDLPFVIGESETCFLVDKGFYSSDVRNAENVCRFLLRIYVNDDKEFDFSADIGKEVFEGYTVTYSMLQLAAYMGIEEIYLLGIDNNCVSNADKNDHAEGIAQFDLENVNKPRIRESDRAFMYAKEFSNRNGFKIYNATRGGKLEVFDRVEFEQLFK